MEILLELMLIDKKNSLSFSMLDFFRGMEIADRLLNLRRAIE